PRARAHGPAGPPPDGPAGARAGAEGSRADRRRQPRHQPGAGHHHRLPRAERGAGSPDGPSPLHPRVRAGHSRGPLGRPPGFGRGEAHLPRSLSYAGAPIAHPGGRTHVGPRITPGPRDSNGLDGERDQRVGLASSLRRRHAHAAKPRTPSPRSVSVAGSGTTLNSVSKLVTPGPAKWMLTIAVSA